MTTVRIGNRIFTFNFKSEKKKSSENFLLDATKVLFTVHKKLSFNIDDIFTKYFNK